MGVGGVGGDPCDLINLRFCVTTMQTCVEGWGGVGWMGVPCDTKPRFSITIIPTSFERIVFETHGWGSGGLPCDTKPLICVTGISI